MNTYIDESGTFVYTDKANSWSSVAGYFSVESDSKQLNEVLSNFKVRAGFSENIEVKLKDVPEDIYFGFLTELSGLNGVLFSVATDACCNSVKNVEDHKATQVAKILVNKPLMKYEEGKKYIQSLADQLLALSPQLYVQLTCQVQLIYDIVNRGITYFVQRFPKHLDRFEWFIDQKNITKTVFEKTFEDLAPALLQTMSIQKPSYFIKGEDYSALSKFDFTADTFPSYLEKDHGIKAENALNIGKLLRENLQFPDSTVVRGVQIADLLAAGIRRSLRGEFNNNKLAITLLGGLMIQEKNNKSPLKLVGFQNNKIDSSCPAYFAVKMIPNFCRPMIKK
jgi:hypothetical protein